MKAYERSELRYCEARGPERSAGSRVLTRRGEVFVASPGGGVFGVVGARGMPREGGGRTPCRPARLSTGERAGEQEAGGPSSSSACIVRCTECE